MPSLDTHTWTRVEQAYAAIPDTVTIADAITLGWGPERNLTLRKALGIPLESGEVVTINRGDIIQVLTATRKRARYLTSRLVAGLPQGGTVTTTRNPDRNWLITAHATQPQPTP